MTRHTSTTPASMETRLCLVALALCVLASCSRTDAAMINVGGDEGWVVPSAPETVIFNNTGLSWANISAAVGDVLNFTWVKTDTEPFHNVYDMKSFEFWDSCSFDTGVALLSNKSRFELTLTEAGTFYFACSAGDLIDCLTGQKVIVIVDAGSGGSNPSPGTGETPAGPTAPAPKSSPPPKPSPGAAPPKPSPGAAPPKPSPGAAPPKPSPGAAPPKPSPGAAPPKPSPGTSPLKPSPGASPLKPSPGASPLKPSPGASPPKSSPGAPPPAASPQPGAIAPNSPTSQSPPASLPPCAAPSGAPAPSAGGGGGGSGGGKMIDVGAQYGGWVIPAPAAPNYPNISAEVGDVLNFTYNDPATYHNVYDMKNYANWDSCSETDVTLLANSTHFELTLTKPGTFYYACTVLHFHCFSGQKVIVNVKAASSSATHDHTGAAPAPCQPVTGSGEDGSPPAPAGEVIDVGGEDGWVPRIYRPLTAYVGDILNFTGNSSLGNFSVANMGTQASLTACKFGAPGVKTLGSSANVTLTKATTLYFSSPSRNASYCKLGLMQLVVTVLKASSRPPPPAVPPTAPTCSCSPAPPSAPPAPPPKPTPASPSPASPSPASPAPVSPSPAKSPPSGPAAPPPKAPDNPPSTDSAGSPIWDTPLTDLALSPTMGQSTGSTPSSSTPSPDHKGAMLVRQTHQGSGLLLAFASMCVLVLSIIH